MAFKNRCPSSRDNHVLRKGFVVKHFITDKLLRIVEIDDSCVDATNPGGYMLETEEVDGVPTEDDMADKKDDEDDEDDKDDKDDEDWPFYLPDEHVYASYTLDANKCYDKTSFCERCYINFDPEFVTWCWDAKPKRRWFDLLSPWRGSMELAESSSSCDRCEALQPIGRVLWKFLKRHIHLRALATYWWQLAHHPRYVKTHALAAMTDLEMIR